MVTHSLGSLVIDISAQASRQHAEFITPLMCLSECVRALASPALQSFKDYGKDQKALWVLYRLNT